MNQPCEDCGQIHEGPDLLFMAQRDFPVTMEEKFRAKMNGIAKHVYGEFRERKELGQDTRLGQFIEDIKEMVKEQVTDTLTPEELGNAAIESLTVNIGGMVKLQIESELSQDRTKEVLGRIQEVLGEALGKQPGPIIVDPDGNTSR